MGRDKVRSLRALSKPIMVPRARLLMGFGTSAFTRVCNARAAQPILRVVLIRLGSSRFRLLFSEHFLSRFKLPLGARVPGRRIDEGMRVSRLAAGELLGTLVDAAPRIAVRVLPGMGHDIGLHALHGVQL